MNIIDQEKVYFGIVVNVAEPKAEGGNKIGYIDPDDPEVKEFIAGVRAAQGRKCKDPGNISFVMPRSGHDTFFACEGNEYGIRLGHRVSFKWRWDKMRMPQAYCVRIEADAPILAAPVAKKGYVDPVQAQIEVLHAENLASAASEDDAIVANRALDAYASEMPCEDDFDDIPDILTDEEIDQDEVDYEAYYGDDE